MIAEDSVQYSLFLVPPDPSDTKDREKCLQQYIERILAQFAPLLTQYIWQNQPFSIKYVPEKGKATELLSVLLSILLLQLWTSCCGAVSFIKQWHWTIMGEDMQEASTCAAFIPVLQTHTFNTFNQNMFNINTNKL